MIDQLVIDKELRDLKELARLNDLKEPRFVVETSEAGIAIVMVEVNGLRTVWNQITKDLPEFEFEENKIKFSVNLVLIAPQYVTIILPDGTIKRGREAGHEQQEEMRRQLAAFYLRHKENQIVQALAQMFPVSSQDLVDLRPQRRPRTGNLVGGALPGLDQLVNSGFTDPPMPPAPYIASYGYCPSCSRPIAGTDPNEHSPGCPMRMKGW